MDNVSILKIYYLFMMADGECTEAEIEKLNYIALNMGASRNEREDAIAYCTHSISMLEKEQGDAMQPKWKNVITILKRILSPHKDTARYYQIVNLRADGKEKKKVLWNIVNLVYADSNYEESENEVVQWFVKEMSINQIVAFEFLDSAECMARLTEKKEWLKTTNKSYDEINAAITKIDDDIRTLRENILDLVEDNAA